MSDSVFAYREWPRGSERTPRRQAGAAAVIVLALWLSGCPSGDLPAEVQMPKISGVVVDAETGAPVPHAEVFIEWLIQQPSLMTAPSHWRVDSRWATTNENGQFLFPEHVLSVPEGAREDGQLGGPTMAIVSRSHYEPIVIVDWLYDGKEIFDARRPQFWARPRDGLIRAARTLPHHSEAMEDKLLWRQVCGSIGTYSANAHCCEVIYQDSDFCCKAVYGTRGAECGRPEGSSEE